ncbi:ClpP-like prohead protease/major capsid protein fusion protein [Marilutibacter alkalisoli]|uniref:ATP-dependent Clp protease proteolytic subunit n=1 Tax=Marilutibacter alkalisoli TaxID=2591633 RepID=A0A514BU70_9GAMM|nr:ClpP-like prohead protease/major capsid protein fusion protein [Lysobacter alkalisoli]QDH70855.1 Clp protease ClpP [Lysobacter alkalisoli]
MTTTTINPLTAAVVAALNASVQAASHKPQDRPHIEPMMKLSQVSGAADTYELLIYGDIGDSWWSESVTAKSVVEQLNALDDTVATINVRINSYGGSVADGLAIYNALNRHKATKAVTVDGVAMSAASLIAMVGDTVHMPAASILMIHAPWGGLYGNAKEMRQYADVLDTFSDAMADAYVSKSGKDRADILSLLKDGEDHYYTGEEAVAEGFADAVSEPEDEAAGEPDENARAFARSLLERITARGVPSNYAGMAVAAALRGGARTSGAAPTPRNAVTVKVDASDVRQAVVDALAELNPPAPSAEPTPPADAGTSTEESTVMNLTEEQKKALAARRQAIRGAFAPFQNRADLDQADVIALLDECLDDDDVTVEQAGAKLLALLGKDTTPTGARGERAEIVRDETDTYIEGGVTALLHRANPSAHKMDDKGRQFAGFDLADMARDSVERAGTKTRGMSKREVAIKALQSTSDFPAILENVVTKSLRAGYQAAGRTFTPFSRQATLPDFKQISRVQLGGAPNLLRVVEGAEYEYGTIGDGAEKYAVQKYGRIVAITWEAIINDDLDALTRIPQSFGASAAELESDIVYAILTGNPNMADGTALFHADHGNLGTPAALADALDATAPDPIAEMRKMMTLQKGIEGRYITVRPKFLIVPPSLEKVALQLTSGNYQPNKGQDINVFGPSLTAISEPRLEDASDTAFFGAAEPTTIDTIEYAYLEGHEGVFTETRDGFNVDGVEVKCRHVFGAKAIDWRGLFKNAGA